MPALNVAWRRSVIALAVILGFFGFTVFFFPATVPTDLQHKIPFPNSHSFSNSAKEKAPSPFHNDVPTNYSPSFINLASVIRALYAPMVVDINTPSFIDRQGNRHKLKSEPIYTKRLGKKLVILDVETRPFNKTGQVNALEPPTWENLDHLSAGIFSHFIYAMIHGYDYKYIYSPEYEDQQGGWTKVIMSHEMMKTHDWVVTMDSDAEFTSPEVPLEWMMNLWNITSETALAMARDPAGGDNFDSKGQVMLNTGFFFSQSAAPKVEEIYQKWGDCPTDVDFVGCSKWKKDGFREQTAFSEHVRYAFPEDGVIKVIPCQEANGFPEAAGSGCTGQLVKHFWTEKELAKRQFADGFMQALVPQLHSLFQDQVIDWHKKTIKGNIISS